MPLRGGLLRSRRAPYYYTRGPTNSNPRRSRPVTGGAFSARD